MIDDDDQDGPRALPDRPIAQREGLADSTRLESRWVQTAERLPESNATGRELGKWDVSGLDDVILGLTGADELCAALIFGPHSDEPVDVVQPFGPILRCNDVVLRPPTAEDVEGRRVLGYDAEILRMFGVSAPIEPSMTTGRAAAWVASLGRDGEIEWVVEHDHRFLGAARLHSFEPRKKCLYAVGFFDQAKLGVGLGRIVTGLVLRHAFDDLGLSEVDVVVLDFNMRAQRCYGTCGFQEVTRLLSDVFDGDRMASDVVMRVTPSLFVSA